MILLYGVNEGSSKAGRIFQVYSVEGMTARPVSQAGIAKIDQLAEKLRQRGSGASTRKYFRKFPSTPVHWLQGVKFY